MTWLELWEFVQALPHDSMTRMAESNDHTQRGWSESVYMQAAGLSLMQQMIQILWVANLEGKPPKDLLKPWPLPDLRSLEQIAEDEAREARQAATRRRYFEATRPGAPQDTEHARRLAQAREQHLRLLAKAAEEPTTEQGAGWPRTSDPSLPPSFPTSRTSPPEQTQR